MIATLTSKNRLTMPREIREHLGLRPGDQVDFVLGPEGEVRVFPRPPKPVERPA
ncbi:MAG: AbrB/MazE/SpoVT family DNA-binding domain-containing protein [Thermoanaerobaculia bacterium]|nr:AbrB/MazE/SpoVT family DNA-binding domain-containing protein [Thermoanaerobaculia bacterium]